MLDIKFIRENLERVKKACEVKNRTVNLERLLVVDKERRKLIQELEEIRAERNEVQKSKIPYRVNKNQSDSSKVKNEIITKGKGLKNRIKDLEERLNLINNEFKNLLLQVPNVFAEDVPIGKSTNDNKIIKTWGKIPEFDFTLLSHLDLMKKHDLVDFERGAKVGGSRMYFLKNEAVQMEMALMWYALSKLIDKGFTPIIPPILLKDFCFLGSGQFPWGKQEVYKCADDDLYLAGTAEVPITAYYANEILKEEDLPKKLVAFSPCFRREAGSYGKDTKGLYRLHQFNKVEQVIICKADLTEGLNWLEILLKNSQELLEDLKLPYRVMKLCTGEMGEPQYKKYDLETWMPSRNSYGETQSDSLMTDFQARRLNLKYRTKNGEVKYCYTLNNTALASPRILIAIIENYQQKDGSIKIPEVLQSYLGKDKITSKNLV